MSRKVTSNVAEIFLATFARIQKLTPENIYHWSAQSTEIKREVNLKINDKIFSKDNNAVPRTSSLQR